MKGHIEHAKDGRPNEVRHKVKIGDTVFWHGANRVCLIVKTRCEFFFGPRTLYIARGKGPGGMKDYELPRSEFERVAVIGGSSVDPVGVEPDYRMIHARRPT